MEFIFFVYIILYIIAIIGILGGIFIIAIARATTFDFMIRKWEGIVAGLLVITIGVFFFFIAITAQLGYATLTIE